MQKFENGINVKLIQSIKDDVLLSENLDNSHIDTKYRYNLGNSYNMMLKEDGSEISFEEFNALYQSEIQMREQ